MILKVSLGELQDRLYIDRLYMDRDYNFITKVDYFSEALLPFNFACMNSPFQKYHMGENV